MKHLILDKFYYLEIFTVIELVYMQKSHNSAVYSFVRHRAHDRHIDRHNIKDLTNPVCFTPHGD